ncbi:MAG: hypothetical protein AB7V01_06335, partial [Vicinamibacterales bacterium]
CYVGRVFCVEVGMSRGVDPASRGGLLYIRGGMYTRVTGFFPAGTREAIWSDYGRCSTVAVAGRGEVPKR